MWDIGLVLLGLPGAVLTGCISYFVAFATIFLAFPWGTTVLELTAFSIATRAVWRIKRHDLLRERIFVLLLILGYVLGTTLALWIMLTVTLNDDSSF
jgi:hypothetical protein